MRRVTLNIILQIVVVTLLLLSHLNTIASTDSSHRDRWREDIIVDPAISRRCHRLKGKRKDKKVFIQRISALIIRNHKAHQSATPTEITAKATLRTNRQKLFEEYHLAKMKLQHVVRQIVRSGCPNIEL
jgi:hypothetical protein